MTRHRKRGMAPLKKCKEHEQATFTEHLLCARHCSGSEIFIQSLRDPVRRVWSRAYGHRSSLCLLHTLLLLLGKRHPPCSSTSSWAVISPGRFNSRVWLSSPKSKQSLRKKSLRGYQTPKMLCSWTSFLLPSLSPFLPSLCPPPFFYISILDET